MDKQKHYAIYWLDPHQNMGVRQWTWSNRGKEKEGGKRERERDTERKESDGLQTRTFEIQVDIHNDSKWANLSQCTQ